jgi:hypothetical protein
MKRPLADGPVRPDLGPLFTSSALDAEAEARVAGMIEKLDAALGMSFEPVKAEEVV